MNPSEFRDPKVGQAIRTKTGYWAFIPAPLPPQIEWTTPKSGFIVYGNALRENTPIDRGVGWFLEGFVSIGWVHSKPV